MSIHFHKEIKRIEKRLVILCTLVEESVRNAVKAFVAKDALLAENVISCDREIDLMEIDVEEECLKILALHQPVAIDLRFVVAVLKMNSVLERVGDLAVGIARRAVLISKLAGSDTPPPFSFDVIIDATTTLLKQSIDAMIQHDSEQAYEILEKEALINEIKETMYNAFIESSQKDPLNIELNTAYLYVARYLERIAEHAVNIAEDVIYMINGEIIRHQN